MITVWLVGTELAVIAGGAIAALAVLNSQTGYQGRHRMPTLTGRHRT
jgi:hypothetical protein